MEGVKMKKKACGRRVEKTLSIKMSIAANNTNSIFNQIND